MEAQTSPSLTLNKTDWKSWLINVVIFMSPIIVLILTQLQQGLAVDWNIIWVTGIGLVLNLFKKFVLDFSTDL